MHSYLTHLFPKDLVPTEQTVFETLSQYPLKQAVNYLAVPWAVLINTRQLKRAPKIKLKGGFTVCQHIRFEKIIPILKRIGIDTLFTPHVPKGKKYSGITVLPFPHFPKHAPQPAQYKDILYSFIGFNSHPTRKKLFSIQHPDNTLIKERKIWHFYSNEEAKKLEYLDILARSRFSICPRGTGASTLRFWESLTAGAIPVTISDAQWLPNCFDWHHCIIQITESDIEKISTIIAAIPEKQEKKMRKKCLEIDTIIRNDFAYVIRDYYKKRNHDEN